MSILLKLFGFTGLPPWAIELIVVALVAGGVWLYHEHVTSKLIDAGRSAQRLDDAKALDKLKTETAKQQADLQKRADVAEDQYKHEKSDLETYQLQHPIISAVQLCQQPPAHRRSGDLQAASAGNAGVASGATNGKVLQPVYPSDSPGAADRLRLLDGLGGLCDSLSARIRESQHR